MATEPMCQAVVIAYLQASEPSFKWGAQCHTQSGMRNYGNPAIVRINQLWVTHTIKSNYKYIYTFAQALSLQARSSLSRHALKHKPLPGVDWTTLGKPQNKQLVATCPSIQPRRTTTQTSGAYAITSSQRRRRRATQPSPTKQATCEKGQCCMFWDTGRRARAFPFSTSRLGSDQDGSDVKSNQDSSKVVTLGI